MFPKIVKFLIRRIINNFRYQLILTFLALIVAKKTVKKLLSVKKIINKISSYR